MELWCCFFFVGEVYYRDDGENEKWKWKLMNEIGNEKWRKLKKLENKLLIFSLKKWMSRLECLL